MTRPMPSFATFLLHEDTESDYRGHHTAPMHDSGSPAWKLTDTYPDDVYGPKAVQYYGTGNRAQDVEAFRLVQRLRGRPDAPVTVYRAVPHDSVREINVGDWVTITRAYAQGHGESALRGAYRILSQSVKARDIFTNGDSIQEWGYDPQPPQSGLTEAHTPVPWQWGPPSTRDDRWADFMIAGVPYAVRLSGTEDLRNWDIIFGRKISHRPFIDTNPTETGNAHAIIATVMDILKTFINTVKPMTIEYSADSPSRIKMYKRLSRMASSINPAYRSDPSMEEKGYFRLYRVSPANTPPASK